MSTPEGETLNYRYDGDLPIGESWAGVIAGDVDFQLNNDLVPDNIRSEIAAGAAREAVCVVLFLNPAP